MLNMGDFIDVNLKHSDTLFTEFFRQFQDNLYFNVALYPGDSGADPVKCHLLMLLAASPYLHNIVTQNTLVQEEEEVTILLPDYSHHDLINFVKSLYINQNINSQESICETLKIKYPSLIKTEDSRTVVQDVSSISTVDDLSSIRIEDLNSSLINSSSNTLQINIKEVVNTSDSAAAAKPKLLGIGVKHIKTIPKPNAISKLVKESDLMSSCLVIHESSPLSNITTNIKLKPEIKDIIGSSPFTKPSYSSLKESIKSDSSSLQQPKLKILGNNSINKLECPVCQKLFSAKRYLKEHEKKKHGSTGKLTFECEVCGKHLSGKNELKIHSRIHSGEKPYHCQDCDKYFRARSTFLIHAKFHAGDKNAVCDECGKKFIQFGDLKKHLRTHTGEKPFKCTECDKSFARKDYLTKHQRSHSNLQKTVKTNSRPVLTDQQGTVLQQNVVLNVSEFKTFVVDEDGILSSTENNW